MIKSVTFPGNFEAEGEIDSITAWRRNSLRNGATAETNKQHREFFKFIWRWSDAFQNDFASRADWCVKSYKETNHSPVVTLGHAADLTVRAGTTVKLSADGTKDPDGDNLSYSWWQYEEADTYKGVVKIQNSNNEEASFTVPNDVESGETIHVVCEVTDDGTPQLTRYQLVVITIKP